MPTSLMVQGTTSDAGKSVLVAGLCRVLARRGVSVAPFKPQNMSLNSTVTPEGGEISRAQALQAQAAGIPPHVDMSPVLLKPSSDRNAQVILLGQPLQDMGAVDYHHYKTLAMDTVMGAWHRLGQRYDYLMIEGAGSPAEINLRAGDIANMGFAEKADVPVIIIADIDRGGVFAQLVGTLELLSQTEQDRICGFVINRFRGDISLLEPGLRWLEERTKKPVLGVLPYLHNLQLDAEDAIDLAQVEKATARLQVVIPALPRISNHTDFDALRLHTQAQVTYVAEQQTPPPADLVILPGSKNVRDDLEWLRTNGWEHYLQRHLRYGGKVLGICGGLQMLGNAVHDPNGIESSAGSSRGLGLLDINTVLQPGKTLLQATGYINALDAAVSGYEIHCGETTRAASTQSFITLFDQREDGAISADGQIAGSYLHGLFDHPGACAALLRWAGLETAREEDRDTIRERELNRLADCIEQHLDLASLFPRFFEAA